MKKYNLLILPVFGVVLIVLTFVTDGVIKSVCFFSGLAMIVLGLAAFLYQCFFRKENANGNKYKQKKLMSKPELEFYRMIKSLFGSKYIILPQIGLSAMVEKITNTSYRNELFRIVDFVLFDSDYNPICAIELNDASHNRADRAERDKKVREILESAKIGIAFVPKDVALDEKQVRRIVSEAIRKR